MALFTVTPSARLIVTLALFATLSPGQSLALPLTFLPSYVGTPVAGSIVAGPPVGNVQTVVIPGGTPIPGAGGVTMGGVLTLDGNANSLLFTGAITNPGPAPVTTPGYVLLASATITWVGPFTVFDIEPTLVGTATSGGFLGGEFASVGVFLTNAALSAPGTQTWFLPAGDIGEFATDILPNATPTFPTGAMLPGMQGLLGVYLSFNIGPGDTFTFPLGWGSCDSGTCYTPAPDAPAGTPLPSLVPAPATLLLVSFGLAGLGGVAWRRRR